MAMQKIIDDDNDSSQNDLLEQQRLALEEHLKTVSLTQKKQAIKEFYDTEQHNQAEKEADPRY